jgi:Virulence factor membrane-bound polymerase, C-terminal/O-Antigen ligase
MSPIRLPGSRSVSIQTFVKFLLICAGFSSWSIANHYPPWVGFHNELAGFAWALLIALYFVVTQPEIHWVRRIQWSAADTIIVVALSAVALQQSLGLIAYADSALLGVYYLLVGYVINLACRASLFDDSQLETLLNTVIWTTFSAGLFAGYIVLYQLFGLNYLTIFAMDHPTTSQLYGNIGQPNHTATLIVISIVCALACYERNIIGKACLAVACSFFLLTIVLVESRTGLLSLLVLAGWWAISKKRIELRLSFVAIVCGVLIYGALLFLVPMLKEWAGRELLDRDLLRSGQESGRLLAATQMLTALKAQWGLGYGFLQVSDAQSAAILAGVSGVKLVENLVYSHNLFFDCLVWFGVPVGLLLTIIAGRAVLVKVLAAHTPLHWSLVACMLPILVHSFTEYPFAYSYFLFPFVFFYSVLERLTYKPQVVSNDLPSAPRSSLYIRISICALACIGALITYEYLELEENHRTARFNIAKIGKTAVDYEPYKPIFLHLLSDLNNAAFVDTNTGAYTAEDMQMLKKLTTGYPTFWIQARYIRMLLNSGDYELAIRQISILKGKLAPKYFEGFIQELSVNKLCSSKTPMPDWFKKCQVGSSR